MPIKYSSKQATARLLEIVALEKSDIIIILILIIGVGMLSVATPVAVQSLVNIVNMGGVMQPLYVVSFIVFLLLLLSGTLYVLENYIVELIQRRLLVRSAIEISNKMQTAQFDLSDNSNPAELMNRFFDVTTMKKSAATLLTVGSSSLLQGLIGCIILVFYSFYFVIAVFFLIVTMLIIVFVIGRNGEPTAKAESTVKYEIAAWLETIAKNLNTFKFYDGKVLVKNRMDALGSSYLQKRNQHFKILFFQGMGGAFLYAFFGTAMLTLGGFLVINGQINLGQFVAAEMIIFSVLIAFVRVIYQLEYYYDMLAALDKVGILQDLPQEDNGTHSIDLNKAIKLTVDMTKSILYDNHHPLKTVAFEVHPNQSLAILGAPGTGKTLLSHLITGLQTASNGVVKYNDIDIRLINLAKVRNHIGFIHRVEIIEGSLLENIQLGRSSISLNEISQLIVELDLQDVINHLDDGMNTILNPQGRPLSSTQIRKLMLARAIVGRPALMIVNGILDELDESSLQNACKILFNPAHHQTLIVLTKYPEIAKRCDQTIHLEEA